MWILRRVAASGLCLLLSSGWCFAQLSETIPNWTAPPYWMPVKAAAEKPAIPGEESSLAPDSVAAVPTAPLAFTGIAPCRLADTRGNGFTGQYGPPQITPSGRDMTITGQCGIPGGAEAVSFSFSAINITADGFFVAYPAGGVFPPVATMAYGPSTPVISNAAVVPLGTAGAITVVAAVTNIDLAIDVNGYYAPQTVVNTVNGLSGAVTLAQGTNITITPSGQTLTIASTGGGSGWSLTGNAGTTPGTNFLGTTDNQALELKVNGSRALRLEPGTTPNVIGGYFGNSVTAGVNGASIGGGGGISGIFVNRVTDDYGTVGGGLSNRAGDNAGTTVDALYATVGGGQANVASAANATVAGGVSNTASAVYSFIGGGFSNTATADRGVIGGGQGNVVEAGSYSTIGGGQSNIAETQWSTVAGGFGNLALGIAATIPGGRSNLVSADYGFAAGRRAHATTAGSFIWGDSTDADINTTAANQFIVRASGGIWLGTTSSPSITIASDFLNTSTGAHLTIGGVWTDNSDANSKENFKEIDQREILSRVATLPITRWSYKAEGAAVEHLGPMAQDFSAAFGLGSDDRSISTLDSSGVALASIQALYEMVKKKDAEIEALKERLSKIEAAVKSPL